MKRHHVALSWFCVPFVLLNACNDDGFDDLQGGIEGSGITPSPAAITTSGEVSALGSIIVNEVEYDLVGATITINGATAWESDLRPGHVTIVEGELGENGTRGIAKRVSVEIPIAGRISAIDVEAGQLTILGQTILAGSGMIVEDGIVGSPLLGLDVGRDVEVSGFMDSSGVLHATRIDSRKTITPLLITGLVTNLDTSTGTFSINRQAVNYTAATLRGFEAPAEGQAVRVAATSFDQDTLVADEVILRSPRLPGESGDSAALQGLVTRFASADDFDVDGRRVVAAPESVVEVDQFVSVTGALIAGGVVQATEVRAVLPGRLVGAVTIDGKEHGVSGLMTGEGAFRLNIEPLSPGPHVLESGLGQMVGSFSFAGSQAPGMGALIGEGCALQSTDRFCGLETPVSIELTKTGTWIDQGSSGLIHVAPDKGEEIWPLRLGYWGGQAGFGPTFALHLGGLYELHQAEFVQGSSVVMSVDSGGRLFFQSADTGCIGNGELSAHRNEHKNLYDVTLKIEGCNGSFVYLNADFEGLATLESVTPWAYDLGILNFWISTPASAPSPAAITFWGSYIGE
jgi:hypothetical protein